MSDVKKMRYPKKRIKLRDKVVKILEEWYELKNSITNDIVAEEITTIVSNNYRRRVRVKKGLYEKNHARRIR